VGVDLDAAARSQLDSRCASEFDRWPYARGEDHEVGVEEGRVREFDRESAARARREGGGRGGEVQGDAATAQVPLHRHRDFVIEWRQDLVGHLHDIHGRSAMDEVLRHLEPDVSGSDDDAVHGASRASHSGSDGRIQFGLDGIHVADAAQHVDAGQIDPGQRRPRRLGTCAEGEGIVALGVFTSRRQLTDGHRALFPVDREHLIADSNVDVE
jgi:hypothetical protein